MPYEHFHSLPQSILSQMHKLGNKLFKIFLEYWHVLVGGDTHIAPGAFAVFVELVGVEQDSARRFDGAIAAAGTGFDNDLFIFKALGQQLVDHLDGDFDDMGRFGKLGDVVRNGPQTPGLRPNISATFLPRGLMY